MVVIFRSDDHEGHNNGFKATWKAGEPVDGGWGSWGSYGSCSKTCGGGTKTRTRSCDSPQPQHGGQTCPGQASESASCNTNSCPIDGGWGSWGSYGSCSKNCGGGTKNRTRSCDSPEPQLGGQTCLGASSQSASCNTYSCPSSATIEPPYSKNWGKWGSWSSCRTGHYVVA